MNTSFECTCNDKRACDLRAARGLMPFCRMSAPAPYDRSVCFCYRGGRGYASGSPPLARRLKLDCPKCKGTGRRG